MTMPMRTPPAGATPRSARPAPPPVSYEAPASSITTDEVTARILAQFATLQAQFDELRERNRQMQQIASMGANLACMSHEINNMVAPIRGWATEALDSDDPALMKRALEIALQQVDVIGAITERVAGLTLVDEQRLTAVRVLDIVKHAESCLVRNLAKDAIQLKTAVPENLHIHADAHQMIQVLFNLLLNARQAIHHRNGRIKITAEIVDDDYVAIHVSDNGAGIPEDKLERIFDAFYTTKRADGPAGGGIGVGLSLCHDIVAEHNGRIDVESTPGVGTTFTIQIPIAHIESNNSNASRIAGAAV